jgi:hypothetical protein
MAMGYEFGIIVYFGFFCCLAFKIKIQNKKCTLHSYLKQEQNGQFPNSE